jgi:2-oxoglutarate dehydrogenase E2 component (dihydrolipoamide succinyltransferase)
VPLVGESITEGTIARWLKKEGDTVAADEPLFEPETDKATSDIPAPASGIVRIAVREGQTVPVGAVVGTIELRAEGAAPVSPPEKKTERRPTADGEQAARPGKGPTPPTERESSSADRFAPEKKAEISPPPSPPTQPTPPSTPAPPRGMDGEKRQPMSAIRQRIAERLVASQHATASLTTFNEADMSAVLEARGRFKDSFREKFGVNLGFMSFFVKACVEALRAYPLANAFIDGSDIVYHDHCHIGIAVSTERGLMVPVLHHAEGMSFAEIEKEIAELAEKARTGKIGVSDLQGGTFTITNGGVFGSLLSTPILNPPQSAILGMHTIQKRPVAVADEVVIRPMMYLALSYDHRLIDGREAVLFLIRIKELIENPVRLLLQA